jgi:hypothetical protein
LEVNTVCRNPANINLEQGKFLNIGENQIPMAKGQDKRKEDKKKPVKTLKEKRAEKRDKKGSK